MLVVIDGLTPGALEQGLEEGRLPALAALAEAGVTGQGTSVFPSLTPVCLSSIATGAYPDVHHIPHLVWYHRGEGRVIEYGSSFSAMRAVGARRAIRDTVFGLSGEHLSPDATTVFEALEDAGLEPAAINFTCYRGRTRHSIRLPEVARRNRWYEAVYGPTHFFFFNVFESERTGAPLAVRSRLEGSIDEYAAAVGRWLVTRDAFDFLVFYLPDYDYASHISGPEGSLEALERTDAALGNLLEAGGGPERFLERYAVLVCSDHGQTPVEQARQASGRVPGEHDRGAAARVEPSRDGVPPRGLPARLRAISQSGWTTRPPSRSPSSSRRATAVARREGEELRFAPDGEGWRAEGNADVLDPDRHPERPRAVLARPGEPDCRRRPRLGPGGLGVRGPRRAAPPRRREPRLPPRGRLGRSPRRGRLRGAAVSRGHAHRRPGPAGARPPRRPRAGHHAGAP